MSQDSTRRTEGRAIRDRAVLVGVQLPTQTDAEHASSLDELSRLATTLGLEPVGRVVQKRDSLAVGGVIGEGKLLELAQWTGGSGTIPSGATRKKRRIDEEAGGEESEEEERIVEGALDEASRAKVVLVDHELSPSQARNLERATGAEVMDRTSVILAIFQRHARTREARLQVEIARLAYDAPRLREGGGGDRQRGGIGGKGAGESSLELDRRRIRDRIAELRAELERASAEDAVRRSRRVERGDTVALVGYTNAGKSSWFRRLTAGDVYVADELFATLDTTVRALKPEVRPRILVSDTVGFIKRLPHDLVASFRSTLDEAREASLLLHVVDAADPAFRDQLAVTRSVLTELGAGGQPSLVLLNKADLLDEAQRDALCAELPEAMMVSARDDDSLAALHARIVAFFERNMVEESLFVPWSASALVHQVHESARVLSEEHDENGTHLRVRAPEPVLSRFRAATP